jgi:hypothetical protein
MTTTTRTCQERVIPESGPAVGDRVKYTIPVRGGMDLGFGEVIKLNRKSVLVRDDKNGEGLRRVDRGLVYASVVFE